MPGDGAFWSSRGRHKPPHLYVGGLAHMVTASTLGHVRLLATPERKDRFTEVLAGLCEDAEVIVIAWVVLDDHYHGILVPPDADALPGLFRRLHATTALELNRLDGTPGRQVWHSVWDRRLYTEGDLYSRINYIHRNPTKHGYVGDPADWPWSSINEYLAAEDAEVLAGLQRFPAPRRIPYD